MNLVPPSSCFFFNSGPKTVLFLSLNVKGDQQTRNKMMPPIMASISRKSFYKVCIIIFRSWIMGDERIIFFSCHIMRDERIIFQLKKLCVGGGHYGMDYAKSKNYAFGLCG
jgi:hypothetical protein